MKKGLWALSPIAALLVLLIVNSFYYGGVSNAPLLFIFVMTAIIAVWTTLGVPLKKRVAIFSSGAGSNNLLLMVWIFMFGLFLAACVTSLCMGTSVGTIVALIPIAAGIAERTEMAMPMIVAAVVGGAFFGDNLSFISDTTIVATQTQGCKLSDKFRFNIKMVLPAAFLVSVAYILLGQGISDAHLSDSIQVWKIIPYLAVLICAAAGVNVLLVLIIGNALTCCTGIFDGSYNLMGWIDSSLQGVMGMSELILI